MADGRLPSVWSAHLRVLFRSANTFALQAQTFCRADMLSIPIAVPLTALLCLCLLVGTRLLFFAHLTLITFQLDAARLPPVPLKNIAHTLFVRVVLRRAPFTLQFLYCFIFTTPFTLVTAVL